jgi:spore maturation protein CgeB
LLSHKSEAKEMGDRGKIAIMEEYNWNKQETILLNMYKSLKDK